MKKILLLSIALLCTMVQGAMAQTEVSSKDALTSAINGESPISVKLTEDIALSNYVDIPSSKTVTIDLNGHSLNRGLSALTDYGIVIRVENGGTLTVKDSGTGGTITGGYDATGGGICVLGTLNFESGTISGCNGTRGGAIYIGTGGTVNMSGGSITGNRASEAGDGIYNLGTLNMKGKCYVRGNITHNVYLVGSSVINVTGAFTEGTSIGVSMANTHKFTSGYSTYNSSTDPSDVFYMDDGLRTATLVDGEAYPGILYVERSWTGSNTGGHVKSETKVLTSSYSSITETELKNDGWYVLSGENVFNDRIIISADVKLILADGSNAEFKKGIRSGAGSKLTIYAQEGGTGTLRATGSGDAANAAIGADENTMGGSLIIHGGTIDVSASEDYGAGIGGGDGESSGMTSITIYGGSVGATGKKSAAGIGGGQHNNTNPTVTIYGGSVTANGGKYGAGIGGGEDRGNGTVTIYGGTVNATGGESGAGIGGGQEGNLTTVTIYGGTVTANGGKYGAGIGGGESGDGGTINIYSGNVTATGGMYTPGIGGGYNGKGGTVTIYDGTVNASSGDDGIGIGGSSSATVNIHGGTVIAYGNYGSDEKGGLGIGVKGGTLTFHMTGGNVTAEAATSDTYRNGAGVGGYYDSNVELHITIDGGTLTAKGGNGGAGIGAGSCSTGLGWINGGDIKSGSEITINGGTVTATAGHQGAGIGGGFGGNNNGTVTINGGTVTAIGTDGGAGIGGGRESGYWGMGGNGGTVIINGGTVTVNVGNDNDDSQAIGHGKGDENSGSLTIADNLCVKNDDGTTTYSSSERVERCRDHANIIIEECGHSSQCTSNGAENHTVHCTYCALDGTTEAHTYVNGNDACTKCGYNASGVNTITIYMANTSGDGYGDATTETVQYGSTYTLPECSAPTNMLFVGWKETTDAPSSIVADDSELASLKAADTEITVTANVTYYARYQSTVWPGGGNGTVSDPYLISTEGHWNTLANAISNKGVDFGGKYIKMTANISVSQSVGSYTDSKHFAGNFDGDGHTLTVTLSGSSQGVAPFSSVKGATIENLHVSGTVTTSSKYASGLVGVNNGGTTNVTNCRVSVTVSKDRNVFTGGIVGNVENGTIDIKGCIFDGSLSSSGYGFWGGFVGSTEKKAKTKITNCLFMPASVNVNTGNECKTFSVYYPSTLTVTNCFYSQTLGTEQGEQGYTVQSGDGLTLDYGGGVNYGNIEAYPFDQGDDTTLGGLLYGGKLYTGGTTKVTFTPETSNGQQPTLSASNGETIANNANGTCTLSMASANVTITATSYSNYDVVLYDGGSTDGSNTSGKTNDETISNSRDRIADVTISGRTLYKDGSWNTLCLPFDVDNISTSTLAGATIMKLDTKGIYDTDKQTGFNASTGILYLYFQEVDEIRAGVPYLIKWASDSNIADPTFGNVEISRSNPEAITSSDGKVSFVGNYDPVTLPGGDKSNLYISLDDEGKSALFYPSSDLTIYSFRAYFQLNGIEAGDVHGTRVMFGGEDDGTTGIVDNKRETINNNQWYTISGLKLNGKPTVKGIYINNGRKVVIK